MDVAVAAKPRVVYGEVFRRPQDQVGTVAWILERYLNEMQKGERPLGSSMVYRLKALQRMPIGKMIAADIVSHDVIEFCRWLRETSTFRFDNGGYYIDFDTWIPAELKGELLTRRDKYAVFDAAIDKAIDEHFAGIGEQLQEGGK